VVLANISMQIVYPTENEQQSVNMCNQIGTVDIFINFNCVCVTWPFKFYWKVIIVILSSLADDVLFCAFSDIRM